MKIPERLHPWILVVASFCIYSLFLGDVHLFDWDEINFAESSREMIASGNYFRVMINYTPFWEKPPLFFWFQVISMKIFGVNEFAARFPNSVFGALTLLVLYKSGTFIRNRKFGLTWALTYFCSFLPFFYFKSGLIDPSFNFFIFVSIYFLIRSVYSEMPKDKTRFIIFSGLINGLAILTKGPVGLLLLILTFIVATIRYRFRPLVRWKDLIFFGLGVLISSSIWYLPELIQNGPWFFEQFIRYQIELFSQSVAGHEQPFFYHFIVVFVGCFPLSIFALPALGKFIPEQEKIPFAQWSKILFWVVLILFSLVRTKIIHYSSMTYLPLSYLAAGYLYHCIEQKTRIKKWVLGILVGMSVLFSAIIGFVPVFFYNKEKFLPYFRDPFAVDCLRTDVSWTGFEWLFGVIFLGGCILLLLFLQKKKIGTGLLIYSIAFTITLTGYLKMVVPRIEQYSQGPAIEFYKELQGRDIYVNVVGFKSYAHFFYFRTPQYKDQKKQTDFMWQLYEPIDKPAYFVTKTTEKYLPENPDLTVVKRKGGFILYRREKTSAP